MSSPPTRIFIVDDHPLVREWLGNLLAIRRDLKVVGDAGDPGSALEAMRKDAPDIAIVDLTMNRGSGLTLIKDIRVSLPRVRVIVLSMHEEFSDIERAFRAGAMGYVMKRESTRLIVEAIRAVRDGRIFANPETLAALAGRLLGSNRTGDAHGVDDLSDREMDVFRRLGAGASTKEIADALGVSLKTVQTYCGRIKEKLGIQDWRELSRYAFLRSAREHGIDTS